MAGNLKQVVTVEEAEAIVKHLTKGFDHPPMKPTPHPYEAALSALANFRAGPAATEGTSKSVGGGQDFSGQLGDIQQGELEKRLMEFEQQTWDLYQLQDTLDRPRLLHECQIRAQGGDHDAKRRLEVLGMSPQTRHQNRANRWEPSPDQLNWRDIREVAPDSQVQATLGPRLWALLIGNDNYPQSPLKGAVNDSLAWKFYLTDFLGVPESHITHIQDADRKTMVAALYDLRDNHNIKESDHIIFAYAGHGSRYDAQVYSFDDDISHKAGSIEALCPVDRGLPRRRATPDISDREEEPENCVWICVLAPWHP
ncbi:hypothetical protein EST38_g5900 [Candolleomyces aberdarensis]|uniref:Peptidase C14 caspase domain-containing protein n=1 Tax=Candolleomyces aberdarensis TaxID=2316362 RepID=A0A4Q2DJ97_9AGAR|nr:hypothetical protein EST38_g5900 [Candolleomyces aberdarensis]